MKIVHLITSLKVGGAESSLCNLLTHLNRSFNQHIVIYFHAGPNVARLKNMGVATHQISGFVSPYDPIGLYRLLRLIRTLKPDLIHSALWSANLLGSFISKLLGIPVVCDLHGDVRDHGFLRNILEKKLVLKTPKRFIAVSASVKNSYVEHMGEGVSARTVVVPNGIDYESVRMKAFKNPLTRQEVGLSQNDFVVGCVGRLAAIKSYDVVIRAIAKIPNIKLCLVGDGPERANLESLAQELAAPVIFVGKRDDAMRFYPLFDCFVLSSQSEGLSIALLEALCFGLPVITTSKDRRHDVIVDGKNGFIVPVGDHQRLGFAIEELRVDRNRSEMKNRNECLVRSRFCVESMAAEYEKIYQKTFR